MQMKGTKYHCCASCIHFRAIRHHAQAVQTYCQRLGYDTKPSYQFECWVVKPQVRKKYVSQCEQK